MHVLVIPSWYPTREAPLQGVYLREQVQALHRRGVRIGVVYPERQSLRRASPGALRHRPFHTQFRLEGGVPTLRHRGWNVLWRLPLRRHRRIRRAQRLAARYLRRAGRPDLIHAHSARWAACAAARIGRAHGIPHLVTEHFSGFARRPTMAEWKLRLAREGLRGARAVLAVSPALRRALVEGGLAEPERTRVLPNMVDTAFFTPPRERFSGGGEGRASHVENSHAEKRRAAAAPKKQPFRFLALGNLKPSKRYGDLLNAFARAFGRRPSVRLEIGGAGAERTALERQARRLGIGRQVLFLGRLCRPAVRRAMQRAHAFVHPSAYETFGVVLIEAMATGLPVVATRCGGPEDIVTPETGLLVPPRAPRALAEALRKMTRRRTFFSSSAIRTYVQKHFGEASVSRRLLHVYRTVRASS